MSNVQSAPSHVHPLIAQLFAAIAPSRTQITYNPVAGIIIRTNGRSQPGTMDEIEQTYGQAF